MATAGDIVTRAAKRINVLAAEEALNASQMVDGLQTLNDLLAGFGPAGIQYVHATLAQTDTLNFPDEQIRNVMLMLCSELADDYGVSIGQSLALAIQAAKLELQAAYLNVDPAVPDRALRRRRPGFYDFARGE
jgi:hypothetical protein